MPPKRHLGSDVNNEDPIDWSGVGAPDTVLCVASRDKNGTQLDTWAEDNHRVRLDPVWRSGNSSVANSDDHENHM